MTHEEKIHMMSEGHAQFMGSIQVTLDRLQINWSQRLDTLADKDLVLLADTRTTLEYLITRVSRVRELVLDERTRAFVRHLEELNSANDKVERRLPNNNTVPMLSIIETEELFNLATDLVDYAVQGFDITKFAVKPRRNGWFS